MSSMQMKLHLVYLIQNDKNKELKLSSILSTSCTFIVK